MIGSVVVIFKEEGDGLIGDIVKLEDEGGVSIIVEGIVSFVILVFVFIIRIVRLCVVFIFFSMFSILYKVRILLLYLFRRFYFCFNMSVIFLSWFFCFVSSCAICFFFVMSLVMTFLLSAYVVRNRSNFFDII